MGTLHHLLMKRLGTLTTRIAARLMARRQAEIEQPDAAHDERETGVAIEEKVGPAAVSATGPLTIASG